VIIIRICFLLLVLIMNLVWSSDTSGIPNGYIITKSSILDLDANYFSKPLKTKLIPYLRGKDVSSNSNYFLNPDYLGLKLGEKYKGKVFERQYKRNDYRELGMSIFVDKEKTIKSMATYNDDESVYEDGGGIGIETDYYLLKALHGGEPIVLVSKDNRKLFVFNDDLGYIVLGQYGKKDYYIAVIDKSVVATEDVLLIEEHTHERK